MSRRYEQKPLLLATAIRNPERFPSFLSALKPFEGRKFTEEVAQGVAQILIKNRIYNPATALKTPELQQYRNTDEEMTDEDAHYAVIWALENLSGHGLDYKKPEIVRVATRLLRG